MPASCNTAAFAKNSSPSGSASSSGISARHTDTCPGASAAIRSNRARAASAYPPRASHTASAASVRACCAAASARGVYATT